MISSPEFANLWGRCPGCIRLNEDATSPEAKMRAHEKIRNAFIARLREGYKDFIDAEKRAKEALYSLSSHPITARMLLPPLYSKIEDEERNATICPAYSTQKAGGLRVFDFYFGFGRRPMWPHWPLIIWAYSLHTGDPKAPIKLFRIQPNIFDFPVEEVSLSGENLDQLFRVLYDKTRGLIGDRLEVNDYCEDCPQRVCCPALGETVRRIFDFSSDPEPISPSPKEIGAELTLIETAMTRLRARRLALRELGEHRIHHGVPIPGWIMRPKRTQRQWIDPHGVDPILQHYGIRSTHNPVSPAVAERHGVPQKVISELTKASKGESTLIPYLKRIDPNEPV